MWRIVITTGKFSKVGHFLGMIVLLWRWYITSHWLCIFFSNVYHSVYFDNIEAGQKALKPNSRSQQVKEYSHRWCGRHTDLKPQFTFNIRRTSRYIKDPFDISKKMHHYTVYLFLENCSTCFVWYLHPSSGAHTNVLNSIWYSSNHYCYLPLL